ncbi:MAG: hypothetical protein WHF31_15275 [Candidatus Dehalobacter alkaniphilus]
MRKIGIVILLSIVIISWMNQFVQISAASIEQPMIQEADVIVNPEIIEAKEPVYKTMPVCSTTSTFKSWMDYSKITSQTSRQWKLQQTAKTDTYGFRRYNGYYMVAMAKQYGPVGTMYIITLSSGETIYAIIGEIKGATTCVHQDGSMIEFIIDVEKILPIVKSSGNVNKVFEGTITEIKVVE